MTLLTVAALFLGFEFRSVAELELTPEVIDGIEASPPDTFKLLIDAGPDVAMFIPELLGDVIAREFAALAVEE